MGEAAQVGEDSGDLTAMAGQELLTFGTRDQRRDLGRHEPGELALLALDRLDQPGVLDGDGNLLREGRDQALLGQRERPNLIAGHVDDADDLAIADDWHAQQRPVAGQLLTGPVVLGISQNVVDVDRPASLEDATDNRRPSGSVWVVTLVPRDERLARDTGTRDAPVEAAFAEVDRPVLCLTEPSSGHDDRVKDGLKVPKPSRR